MNPTRSDQKSKCWPELFIYIHTLCKSSEGLAKPTMSILSATSTKILCAAPIILDLAAALVCPYKTIIHVTNSSESIKHIKEPIWL